MEVLGRVKSFRHAVIIITELVMIKAIMTSGSNANSTIIIARSMPTTTMVIPNIMAIMTHITAHITHITTAATPTVATTTLTMITPIMITIGIIATTTTTITQTITMAKIVTMMVTK